MKKFDIAPKKPFNPMIDVIVPMALLTVDCGNCGSFDYRLRVAPQKIRGEMAAKLTRIECAGCGTILVLTKSGHIEGKGESSFSPLLRPIKGVK